MFTLLLSQPFSGYEAMGLMMFAWFVSLPFSHYVGTIAKIEGIKRAIIKGSRLYAISYAIGCVLLISLYLLNS
jgi:hypothetical protein